MGMSTSVTKKRGLGAGQHSIHLILTVVSCGGWLFIWIPWWIIRMVIRRKETTRHYH